MLWVGDSYRSGDTDGKSVLLASVVWMRNETSLVSNSINPPVQEEAHTCQNELSNGRRESRQESIKWLRILLASMLHP